IKSGRIATIQGGNDKKAREYCCKNVLSKLKEEKVLNTENNANTVGFLIGGLGFGDSLQAKFKSFKLSHIRLVRGCVSLNEVWIAIANGMDAVISAYPTQLTEQGLAMTNAISPVDMKTLATQKNWDPKIDKICIRDLSFAQDSAPLLSQCSCFTCQRHSRAYIRHLFNTHEMNAHILLQMFCLRLFVCNRLVDFSFSLLTYAMTNSHNIHRYLQFVDAIREHIQNDNIQEFAEWWQTYQLTLCSPNQTRDSSSVLTTDQKDELMVDVD
ncbi:hypothetical protein RFI_15751, partial [Reticulomyxa filosa]